MKHLKKFFPVEGMILSFFLMGCSVDSAIPQDSVSRPSLEALSIGLIGTPPMLKVISDHSTQGTAVAIKGIGTVTANHVLQGRRGTMILEDGRDIKVKPVFARNDLLRLDKPGPLPLEPGPCPRVGETVVLLGATPPNRTTGQVVQTGVKEVAYGIGMRIEGELYQGFSGGAVVDNRGRIVGIILAASHAQWGEIFAHDLSVFGLPGC